MSLARPRWIRDSVEEWQCVVISPRSPRQAANYANSCSLQRRSGRTHVMSLWDQHQLLQQERFFFLPRNLRPRASVGNISQPRCISHFGELRFRAKGDLIGV